MPAAAAAAVACAPGVPLRPSSAAPPPQSRSSAPQHGTCERAAAFPRRAGARRRSHAACRSRRRIRQRGRTAEPPAAARARRWAGFRISAAVWCAARAPDLPAEVCREGHERADHDQRGCDRHDHVPGATWRECSALEYHALRPRVHGRGAAHMLLRQEAHRSTQRTTRPPSRTSRPEYAHTRTHTHTHTHTHSHKHTHTHTHTHEPGRPICLQDDNEEGAEQRGLHEVEVHEGPPLRRLVRDLAVLAHLQRRGRRSRRLCLRSGGHERVVLRVQRVRDAERG